MSKTFTHLNEMLKRLTGWIIKQITLTFIIGITTTDSTRSCNDKHDAFNFHTVNFPFLSNNIPSSPLYGVYISQLIRHARCCTCYDDIGYRHKLLMDTLLFFQGYKVKKLRNSFKKFYDRYPDVVAKYQKSITDMMNDSFPFLIL